MEFSAGFFYNNNIMTDDTGGKIIHDTTFKTPPYYKFYCG